MPAPSIGFIAPTQEIADRARVIAGDLGILDRLTLDVASLEEALEIARQLEREGVEVFAARSGTAELISRTLPTPVVQIPITPQDMAKCLGEAKQLTGVDQPRVALFATDSIRDDLKVIADLMGLGLTIYGIGTSRDYLRQQVLRAIREGAQVIVAGSIATVMADEYGLPNLMLDSGDIALRSVLQEASRVAYARKLEKTQAERFRIVVDTSRDGVFVLDHDGRIQVASPAASRILGLAFNPQGRHVDEIVVLPGLAECLDKGVAVQDALVNAPACSIIINITPTMIKGDVSGAVVSFQPAESITALENKIRSSLYTKGFVSQYTFEDILGVSPQMLEAVQTARSFASSPSTVLLCGETGVGKELFAHAIHAAGWCAQGPFVAVNCSALPASLLESELFGYEEGAFTGANRKGKPGLFELAHHGTLFLDEISEMNQYAQLRLLRVLQERRTMRLGGDRYIPVEVRVIAASNRNLWDMVRRNKFRQDLFYRLNVLALAVPPLREREGDVPLLAAHFARKCRSRYGRDVALSPGARERLLRYEWPGNVRELQNVMERLTLAKGGKSVGPADLDAVLAPIPLHHAAAGGPRLGPPPESPPGASLSRPPAGEPVPGLSPAAQAEREGIVQALRHCQGHQGRAAQLLGMDRTTLYRKMRRLGIRKHLA